MDERERGRAKAMGKAGGAATEGDGREEGKGENGEKLRLKRKIMR